MKKKIEKFLLSCSMSFPYVLLAARVYASSPAAGANVSIAGGSTELNAAIGDIIGILFWIACVVCTVKIIQIGILYMTHRS